jgi:ABC-2 type transport system ATP-binding protein
MDRYSVSVDQLTVKRGEREVLHGLSFTASRGSITGLLGPSGCGKTTLLRSIVGVQIVTGGTVTVLGHPAGSAILRGAVGYATQGAALYTDLTVAENLRYFAAMSRVARSEVDRVIYATGLGSHAGQVVAQLSGGERSRASLAVALLGSPELLVLDEPTVGLDPVLRNELWALFHQLGQGGATLLISSHVMDEAERCERLLLMRDGRLLADDTPDALLHRTGATDLEGAFLCLVQGMQVVA